MFDNVATSSCCRMFVDNRSKILLDLTFVACFANDGLNDPVMSGDTGYMYTRDYCRSNL